MPPSGEEVDAGTLAKKILSAAKQSATEEDFKIRTAGILRDIFQQWGISWKEGAYEFTLVTGARPDALYGHLIIEYEKPGAFEKKPNFDHAIEQLKGYITDEASSLDLRDRYFGVALDGFKIGFTRFRANQWLSQGPFELNQFTAMRLIEAIRGLKRKLLEVDFLVK